MGVVEGEGDRSLVEIMCRSSRCAWGWGMGSSRVELVCVAGNSEMGKGVSGTLETGGEVGNGAGETGERFWGGSRGGGWKQRRRGVDAGDVEAVLGCGGSGSRVAVGDQGWRRRRLEQQKWSERDRSKGRQQCRRRAPQRR